MEPKAINVRTGKRLTKAELIQDLLGIHGIDLIDIDKETAEQDDENETFGFADYLETDEPKQAAAAIAPKREIKDPTVDFYGFDITGL